MELGYHLCYGSPADEHLVMPKDMSILVEISNGVSGVLNRRMDFMHMPVAESGGTGHPELRVLDHC